MPQQFEITAAAPLLTYLLETLQINRRTAKNFLKHGAITVNGTTTRQFDQLLRAGDHLAINDADAVVAQRQFKQGRIEIIYDDDSLIVIDKPPGLLTVATDRDKTDTLFYRLSNLLANRNRARPQRAWVVHRLDQDTSGLVLFAKSELIKQQLQTDWPNVSKSYWAVVEGKPQSSAGTIDSYLTESQTLQVFSNEEPTLKSKRAVTHYRVLASRAGLSLVELQLETGRKHQIRVHLAELGCPVIGDRRYGAKSNPADRLGLHAIELSFAHPLTGETLSFRSPWPKALARLIVV